MVRALVLLAVPVVLVASACSNDTVTRPGYPTSGKVRWETRTMSWHDVGQCPDASGSCSGLSWLKFDDSPGHHDGWSICSNDLRDQLKKRGMPTADVNFRIDEGSGQKTTPCGVADAKGNELPGGECNFPSLEKAGACIASK